MLCLHAGLVNFPLRVAETHRKICESWRFFCRRSSRANAELTPYALMARKPVEAVERLALKGKAGDVKNESRIMSLMPWRKPSP